MNISRSHTGIILSDNALSAGSAKIHQIGYCRMALRADTKTWIATIHKIALYMGNGSFYKRIKRD
jgi:hypothetical protein